MHLKLVLRIVGMLLMTFSVTLAIPALISLLAHDSAFTAFSLAFALTFSCGLLAWLAVRKVQAELSIRDGFLVVAAFWTVLGLFGSLPFMLAPYPHLSASDAIFESISGLTTTGSTVIEHLDELPVSILFYRQFLQWLGGIGIIVIAVAILPMLGIGGMQLYRAEIPGPIKDKLTPRIADTAKALFAIYLILTAICALVYWALGMNTFDAVGHALSTISTGGYSPHDASMGYFLDRPAILIACSCFMLIAGINFAVHFTAWHRKRLSDYFTDAETRFYLAIVALASIAIVLHLIYSGSYTPRDSVLMGAFHVISIVTSTGFTADSFSAWPTFLPMLLMMLAMIGGCAGSTAGGVKMVRFLLIVKQGIREMKQLVHPNAIIPLKVGRRRVEAKIVSAVWSFMAVYTVSFALLVLALMETGLDYETAFSATAVTINNTGPGLGAVAANFASISDPAKWLLSYSMLLGRLEIFTLLILLTPAFWRR